MIDKITNLKPILLLSLKVVLPAIVLGFYILPNIAIFITEKPLIVKKEEMVNVSEEIVSEEINVSKDCRECHLNIAAEIQATPVHKNFDCRVCHPGMSRRVSCLECHRVVNFSAHAPFMKWAEKNSMMYSSNEACIGCHTHAEIEIYDVTGKGNLEFNADLRHKT